MKALALTRPSHSVSKDEQASRNNHHFGQTLVDSLGRNIESKRTFANVLIFCRVLGCTCGCEDKEPSRLPQATPNQRHSSTELSIKRVSIEKVSGGERERLTFSITYNPPNVQPKLTAPRMIWVT